MQGNKGLQELKRQQRAAVAEGCGPLEGISARIKHCKSGGGSALVSPVRSWLLQQSPCVCTEVFLTQMYCV